MKKNESGMSITLVVMMMALASVMMLGTIAMLVEQRKQQAEQRINSLLDDIEGQIRASLASADAINRSVDPAIYNFGTVGGGNVDASYGNQALHHCLIDYSGGAWGPPAGADIDACPFAPPLATLHGTTPYAFTLYSPLSTAAAGNQIPVAGGGKSASALAANLIRLVAGNETDVAKGYTYYQRNGELCLFMGPLSGVAGRPNATDFHNCPIRTRTGFGIGTNAPGVPLDDHIPNPTYANLACLDPGGVGPTAGCLYFTYLIERWDGNSWIVSRPYDYNAGLWNPGGSAIRNVAGISPVIGPFSLHTDPANPDILKILAAQ